MAICLQVHHPRGLRDVRQRGVVGMEGQRDEGLEAAGLVLQLAQAQHVVDAVLVVLHVAVEHRRVGAQPDAVRRTRRLQPLRPVDLVVADDVPHAVGKYLRPAPRQRIHARRLQPQQRLLDRHLVQLSEERHLHHGEGLDMHLGVAHLQPANQVLEVLEGQIGMQSADDVELGDRLGQPGARRLPSLLQRHGVRSGRALLAPEGAQPAARHADIRWVDVPVHVEVGDVAVHPLAHRVGHPAHGQDVARAIQRHAVVEAQPLARLDPGGNRPQRRVAGLEAVPRSRVGREK